MLAESPRLDFRENVRGGGKIFRGGATMIARTEQQTRTVYTNRDFAQTLHSRAYKRTLKTYMPFPIFSQEDP